MREQLAIVRRIYSLAGPGFIRHAVAALGAGLAPVLYNLMLSFAFKNVFAAAGAKSGDGLISALLFFILGSVGFYVFNGTMWGIFGSSVVRVTGRIRKKLFAHLAALPADSLMGVRSAQAMTLFTNDAGTVETLYGYVLRYTIASVLSGSVAAAVLLCGSPAMGLVVLATGFLQLSYNLLFVKPLQALSRRIAAQIDEIGEGMTTLLEGNITIRLYGMEGLELKRYGERSRRLAGLNTRYSLVEGIIRGGNLLAGLAGYLLTLGFGTWMVSQRMLSLPDLLFLTQIRLLMMLIILAVGEFSQLSQPALAGARRILAFLDKPVEMRQTET